MRSRRPPVRYAYRYPSHSFAPGISIRRIEAVIVLRDRPQRWSEVVRYFIRRFGRRAAEKLLGTENLDAVLRGELWARLTVGSVHQDDPRQLHLWPDNPQSLHDHPRRTIQPPFDEHLYRERHRIENLFARLKAFRRIATRYEKLHATFAATVSLACILVWLKL